MLRRKAETMRVLVLVAMFFLFPHSEAASNNLMSPDNIQCACVGDVLTFTCSIVGGGNTIWRGSAFSCSSTNNEIILRHSQFSSQSGTSGSCNSGAIVGQSVGVEGNCFTSQLNVSISEGLNDRNVQCDHNNLDAGTTNIGSTTLSVLVTNPYPPPNDVGLIDFDQGQVTFNWTSVSSSCPTIDYVITSDCGVCLSSTNSTTVTCFDLQLPTQSDNSVCSFNVSSRVCGIVGDHTTSVLAARVPSVPFVNVVPHYSNQGNQALMELSLTVMTINDATEVIINDISGSILSYIVTYSTPTTVIETSSISVESLSCKDDVCNFTVTVPSSVCSSSSDINVAVSAANRIGRGQSSDGVTIGCTNQFVQVEYDKTASTITCRFHNETDTSVKLCTVMYGECGQELVQTTQGSSTMETPNNIVLSVDANVLECYSVTASSDVLTVIVDSGSATPERGTVNIAAIVVPIIVIIILVLVLLVVLVSVCVKRRRYYNFSSGGHTENESKASMSGINEIELKTLPENRFLEHPLEVDHNCELREFLIKEKNLKFKRGCAFYEFVHEFESIDENQEVILSMKKLKEPTVYFSLDVNSITLKQLRGHKVPKPISINDYRVFVQCTGSGARHLPALSLLLYEAESQNSLTSLSDPDPPLKLIISNHFEMTTLSGEVTIEDFCKDRKIHHRIFLKLNAFETKPTNLIDVILQEKETKLLYTGPPAHNMVNQHYSTTSDNGLNLNKWNVFVLCEFDRTMKLQRGTTLLHQNPVNREAHIDDFHMLTVDEEENCMCMSDFIKKKAMVAEFTNGHAFYEFKEEKKDLLYYKDVVFLQSTLTRNREEEISNPNIYVGFDQFYRLRGVPAVEVNPPTINDVRVFIQSTSQGARCVKCGETIIYKKTKADSDSNAT